MEKSIRRVVAWIHQLDSQLAQATVALFVVGAAVLGRAAPTRAVLLGLTAWFGVQGAVAIGGVASGTVGGLAWLAVVADPLIAVWFFVLSTRCDTPVADLPSPGSHVPARGTNGGGLERESSGAPRPIQDGRDAWM